MKDEYLRLISLYKLYHLIIVDFFIQPKTATVFVLGNKGCVLRMCFYLCRTSIQLHVLSYY
jgi:hypothetical protein